MELCDDLRYPWSTGERQRRTGFECRMKLTLLHWFINLCFVNM